VQRRDNGGSGFRGAGSTWSSLSFRKEAEWAPWGPSDVRCSRMETCVCGVSDSFEFVLECLATQERILRKGG